MRTGNAGMLGPMPATAMGAAILNAEGLWEVTTQVTRAFTDAELRDGTLNRWLEELGASTDR